MSRVVEACNKIKAISVERIPCVFLGVRWIADVQPDCTERFGDCAEECLEYANSLVSSQGYVDFLPGIWTRKMRRFGTTQVVRMGDSRTEELLDRLASFGFSPNELFDPYTLDSELLTSVAYSHVRRRKGQAIRVRRHRDIFGKVYKNFTSVPRFESIPYHDGDVPLQWTFNVVAIDFCAAAIEALERRGQKARSDLAVIGPPTSSSNAGLTAAAGQGTPFVQLDADSTYDGPAITEELPAVSVGDNERDKDTGVETISIVPAPGDLGPQAVLGPGGGASKLTSTDPNPTPVSKKPKAPGLADRPPLDRYPELDKQSGDWVLANAKIMKDRGWGVKTLRTYRNGRGVYGPTRNSDGEATYGRLKNGMFWRRDPDAPKVIWYLVSEIVNKRPYTKKLKKK